MKSIGEKIADGIQKFYTAFINQRVLTTPEEVQANTNEKNLASAVVVGEIYNNLTALNDNGQIENLHIGEDGKPYITYKVGADSVTKKLGSFEVPEKIVCSEITISSSQVFILPTYDAEQILITAPVSTAKYEDYIRLDGCKTSLGKYFCPAFQNGTETAMISNNANGKKINVSDYTYLKLWLAIPSSTAAIKNVTFQWFYD